MCYKIRADTETIDEIAKESKTVAKHVKNAVCEVPIEVVDISRDIEYFFSLESDAEDVAEFSKSKLVAGDPKGYSYLTHEQRIQAEEIFAERIAVKRIPVPIEMAMGFGKKERKHGVWTPSGAKFY